MRNIVCPHCQQAVQVPDYLAQPRCIRCGQTLDPVNTQFTATPSALTPDSIQPIDQFERGEDAPRVFTDWDEFRATSPAVQQELLELARRPMPDLRNVCLKPLPEDLPPGIDRWKRPLGTIETSGDSSVVFWIRGLLMLFLGGVGALGCGSVMTRLLLGRPQLSLGLSAMVLGFGISSVVVVGSIWHLFFRRRKRAYTLWIFEEGIFWQTAWRDMGSVPWQEVCRFQMGVNPVTRMPIYWLKAADQVTFDIEIDKAPALIPLLEYMEIRLTAAQLLPRLEQIYSGRRIGYGAVQLDRQGLTRGKFFAPWSQIERVVRDREQLFVHVRGRADWVSIPYAAVSFPLVVMAIAHVLIAEEMTSGSSEPEA